MEKNKLRIIHIIPTLQTGGAERFAVDLAVQTKSRGHDVEIVCLQNAGGFADVARAAGISVTILDWKPKLTMLSVFSLVRIFRVKNPDVVHLHLLGGIVYGSLAAKLAGVPRIVATEQNVYGNIRRAEGRGRGLMRKLAAYGIDVVIAASQAIQNDIITRGLAAEHKTAVIPNGIAINRVAPAGQSRDNHARGAIVIGCVGRLVEQKGFDVVIEAMKIIKESMPTVILRIAGDGPLRSDLARLIQRYGLADTVFLAGAQKDIGGFLQTIDMFVMPSRWEGFGVVLLEAGLAGLPVVASATGGITDIIDDRTGVLVPAEDAPALARAILALAPDAGRRRQLGAALQSRVQQQFAIETVAALYRAVYEGKRADTSARFKHYEMEKSYAQRILATPHGSDARKQMIASANSEVSRFKAAVCADEHQGGGDLTLKTLQTIAKPGDTILDFGCGRGELVRRLRERGYRAYGFDVSAYDVDAAQCQAGNDREVYVSGDLATLSVQQFDIIVMDNVIEHIVPDELAETLRKCYELLQPGGLLYIVTPHRFAGPHDVSRYVLPLGAKAEGFHFQEFCFRDLIGALRIQPFSEIVSHPFHPALTARVGFIPSLSRLAATKSFILERLFSLPLFGQALRFNRTLTRAVVGVCFPAIVAAKK